MRFLQWPLIAIGVSLMVVSLAGYVGSCYRNTFLMYLYMWAMFFIIDALIGFVIFGYAVTDKGSGRPVLNRAYLEYNLEDYSGWLERRVSDHGYWAQLKSYIRDSGICSKMGRTHNAVPESSNMFFT
ncbi:Tetraspanin-3 [Bienertia sinuspersici]